MKTIAVCSDVAMLVVTHTENNAIALFSNFVWLCASVVATLRGVMAKRYRAEPNKSDDINAYDDIALSLIPRRAKSMVVSPVALLIPLPPPDKVRILESAENDAFRGISTIVLDCNATDVANDLSVGKAERDVALPLPTLLAAIRCISAIAIAELKMREPTGP